MARRLGYSSEFQLSRSLKRFEGVSPTVYLKSMTTKQWPCRRRHVKAAAAGDNVPTAAPKNSLHFRSRDPIMQS